MADHLKLELPTASVGSTESLLKHWEICLAFGTFGNSIIEPKDEYTSRLTAWIKNIRSNMFIECSKEVLPPPVPPSERIDIDRLFWGPKPGRCTYAGCQMQTITRKTCAQCRKFCHIECGYETRMVKEIPFDSTIVRSSTCSETCWNNHLRIYKECDEDDDGEPWDCISII